MNPFTEVLEQRKSRYWSDANQKLRKYESEYLKYAKELHQIERQLVSVHREMVEFEALTRKEAHEVSVLAKNLTSDDANFRHRERRLQELEKRWKSVALQHQNCEEAKKMSKHHMQRLKMKACEIVQLFDESMDMHHWREQALLQKPIVEDLVVVHIKTSLLDEDVKTTTEDQKKLEAHIQDLSKNVAAVVDQKESTGGDMSALEDALKKQQEKAQFLKEQREREQSQLDVLQRALAQCKAAVANCGDRNCQLEYRVCESIQQNLAKQLAVAG